MRATLPAVLLGVVATSAGLAGCIQGAFFPAEIPAASLASGWAHDSGNSQSGEEGLDPIVKARYRVNAYTHAALPQGLAYVISVSDVPLLDEQAEIKKQLDPRIAESGVQLTERTRGTGSIGGATTSYVVYDATQQQGGATLRGFAIDAPYTCPANSMAVRVFGFAMTELGSVLGQRTDRSSWEELAGNADQGSLGGMVTQVRCS